MFRDHLCIKKNGIRSNPIESGPEDGFSDANSASNFLFTKNLISKDCFFIVQSIDNQKIQASPCVSSRLNVRVYFWGWRQLRD